MSYKLRYLPLAVNDIDKMAAYLSQFYPHTAGRVLGAVEKRIADLQQHPQMYAEYSEDSYYRCFPVSNYIVFYHVNSEKETVEIHRILRGSWNLPEHLGDHEKENE